MKKITSRFLITLVLLLPILAWQNAEAEVTLPAMFSDHMVLQRDVPVAVWGWADPGEAVSGAVGDQEFSTTADQQGRWSVKIDPLPTGGPLKMSVTGTDSEIVINNVYVGEVWLCSGQSNMAMTVNRVANAEKECAEANYPEIRMFKVTSFHATELQDTCEGVWSVCTPESVGLFSATAYFFGRHLHEQLNIPIGLINSSVGGTSIESWTSMSAQRAVPAIKPRLDAWEQADAEYDAEAARQRYEKALELWKQKRARAKAGDKNPGRKPVLALRPKEDRNYPSNHFNSKINPLIPYTVQGAIWYQGENSSGRGFAQLYHDQLKTLIEDWRSRWAQGDFPFAWVQLPNYRQPQQEPVETSGWVLVQEGMLKTLSVPNTGMAVTIDIGEADNIHPKNKQDVGKRLALWALADVYDKDVPASGPIYASCKQEGSSIVVKFDYAYGGLYPKDGQQLEGFAIAGPDRKFVWADARIDGDTVVVSSPEIQHPVSVRYAWAANPECNLYNQAGLPASPFRTDDWDESGNQ